ncbi:MAG: asparaginase [Acidimicrobiia bacterium]|nr:asparaginase [Acidimicrobiia bacterium]
MLAHTVRSGLPESLHRGAAVAVDGDGQVLYELGNIDRPIFYRSAIKPLQALVALRVGVKLTDEEIAITCASHSGYPIHLAYVRKILSDVGLGEDALQTPFDWPLGVGARDLVIAAGHRRKQRIWHNCSGKHAGWIAACLTAGWDHTQYLSPDSPLQREILEIVHDATALDPKPTGVDGCGAPTLLGSVRGLARAFATLSSEPEYAATARAVHRFSGLVGSNDRADGRLSAWWDGPIKAGAQGLIGAGRRGVGIAVRSESGNEVVAVLGLIAVARELGLLSKVALEALAGVAAPPVFGGGEPVGTIEPVMQL